MALTPVRRPVTVQTFRTSHGASLYQKVFLFQKNDLFCENQIKKKKKRKIKKLRNEIERDPIGVKNLVGVTL